MAKLPPIPLYMRLFTANFLQCHVRSCDKNSYPLHFQSEGLEVQIKAAEYNGEFLAMAMQMGKVDYAALKGFLKEVLTF